MHLLAYIMARFLHISLRYVYSRNTDLPNSINISENFRMKFTVLQYKSIFPINFTQLA